MFAKIFTHKTILIAPKMQIILMISPNVASMGVVMLSGSNPLLCEYNAVVIVMKSWVIPAIVPAMTVIMNISKKVIPVTPRTKLVKYAKKLKIQDVVKESIKVA